MIKVEKLSEVIPYFKKQHKKYAKKIHKDGGYIHHLRAFTAQILWILLLYEVYIRIVPISNILSSSAVFIILMIAKSILDQITNDILPEYISDALKGKFFYDFDSGFLIKIIIVLLVMDYIMFLIPLNIAQKMKKYIHYGK